MKTIYIVLVAAIAAIGGFFLQQSLQTTTNTDLPPAAAQDSPVSVVGQLRPDFSLPDLEDKQREMSEWDGKIRLVNFWATWCPPCVREMPAFVEMQNQYKDKDFVIIGIAIDYKNPVQDFVDSIGVNYPILYGEMAALELTTAYGNRLGVLPFSVFIGKDNKIISVHNGEITADTIKTILSSQNIQ